ncbi:hypothetical protein F5Y17DRAFT_124055 [Xylariaceae sp. FL0594]|nr:hypothetical protein F5Y17DRAFT_124055 [Xylariaceae sp. FL0594]
MWSFGTTMTMPKDHESATATATASASNPSSQSQSQSQPIPRQSEPIAQPHQTLPPRDPSSTSILSPRSLRQLGLFFAGAGFLSLATLVTRRSVARKTLATIPRFFVPSNRAPPALSGDSSAIALEALSLATLNVMGFGIMMTGGLAWAFDVSSFEDIRRRTRGHLAASADGATRDEEAERELEEWVAKILSRRQGEKGKEEEEEKKGEIKKV